MRKCGKSWASMKKCVKDDKVWDSALTVENVWESVLKVEKVCINRRNNDLFLYKLRKSWIVHQKLRKCASRTDTIV